MMASSVYGITNGQPDNDGHPYVCLVIADVSIYDENLGDYILVPAWRGSGSLIEPTVVLTSGHITIDAARIRVYFDSDVTGTGYPITGEDAIGTPYTCPEYEIGFGEGLPGFTKRDVGIVVLDTPVDVGGFAELPQAGIVDTLKVKTDVELVGYGSQDMVRGGGQPSWTDDVMRMYAPSETIANKHVISDEFLRCTSNPGKGTGGTTFGDSGGPVLLGDTDTVLAVHSFGTNYQQTGVSYHSRVDIPEVLDWINGFMP
jgi:hypothetical protein